MLNNSCFPEPRRSSTAQPLSASCQGHRNLPCDPHSDVVCALLLLQCTHPHPLTLYPRDSLLFEWKYVQLCYFSLKDEVIILSPSKCTALTFQSSAVKCKPLTGSDPQESLQCFSLAVKAASVKGGKYIYYSLLPTPESLPCPPFPSCHHIKKLSSLLWKMFSF